MFYAQFMGNMRARTPARILIADDHDLMRRAIRELVETCQDFEVVGEAKNGLSAVELARRLHPHIVLMDFHMPVMDGREATRAIRQELPDIGVIGLSVHPQTETLMRGRRLRPRPKDGDLHRAVSRHFHRFKNRQRLIHRPRRAIFVIDLTSSRLHYRESK
jgi:CheY-like chemotaxis protein